MRFIPSRSDPLASPCLLIPLVEAGAKTHQSVTIYHTAQVGHKGVNPFTCKIRKLGREVSDCNHNASKSQMFLAPDFSKKGDSDEDGEIISMLLCYHLVYA